MSLSTLPMFSLLSADSKSALEEISMERIFRKQLDGSVHLSQWMTPNSILAGVSLYDLDETKAILATHSKSKGKQQQLEKAKCGQVICLFQRSSSMEYYAYRLTEADFIYLHQFEQLQKDIAANEKAIREAIPQALMAKRSSLQSQMRAMTKTNGKNHTLDLSDETPL